MWFLKKVDKIPYYIGFEQYTKLNNNNNLVVHFYFFCFIEVKITYLLGRL